MLSSQFILNGVAAISALLLISFAPFLIYHYNKYRSLQKCLVFRKRYAEIVAFEVQIGLFKIVIAALIYISLLLWYDGHKHYHQLSLQFNVLSAVDYATTLILFYLWIWRFWLLHFGIHINIALLSNEWKCVINSNHKDHKIDWYLYNRNKYGNKTYIRNRFIIPLCVAQCILLITPMFLSSYYYNTVWTIYYSFHLFIPFSILMVIYFKTCKFSDNFYITKELGKIFMYVSMTAGLVFVINIIDVSFNFSTNMSTIFYCLQMNVIWIGIFLSIITAIYWVPKRVLPLIINRNYQFREIAVRKNETEMKTSQLKAQLISSGHTGTQYSAYYENNANNVEYIEVLIMEKQIKPKKVIGNVQNRKIKLSQILSHFQGFGFFVNHLAKEYSVECLLSLVEMVQFQQKIYEIMTNESKKRFDAANEDKTFWFKLLAFPSNVPKSEIVYGTEMTHNDLDKSDTNQMIQRYKGKAYEIYLKYIDYNALFQINIPFAVRQKIAANMALKDISLSDLLMLFDKSCAEMIKLMRSSYDRFSFTHNYHKLKKCVFL